MFDFIVVFGTAPFYFPPHTPTPMEWESSPPSMGAPLGTAGSGIPCSQWVTLCSVSFGLYTESPSCPLSPIGTSMALPC